MNTTLVIVDR